MDWRQASAVARWTLGTLCLLLAVGVVGWFCFLFVLFLVYLAPQAGPGNVALLVAFFVGVPVLLFGIVYVIVELRVRGAGKKRRRTGDHQSGVVEAWPVRSEHA